MIYVVRASGGEYSECWWKGIAATRDRDIAEAHVLELDAKQAHLMTQWGELTTLFQTWMESNPMPPRPKFEPNAYPRKPTPKQRARYDETTRINANRNREWSAQQLDWARRAQEVVDRARAERGIELAIDWYQLQAGSYAAEVQFDIEELPELK